MKSLISMIILSVVLANCGFKPIYSSKKSTFQIIEIINKNENKNSFFIENTIMSLSNKDALNKLKLEIDYDQSLTTVLKDIKKDQNANWPAAQKEYLEEKYVNIVIQINGKKKSLIQIEKNLDEKILIENVKKDKKISNFLEKKSIFKHIIVKNKLINLIVK